MKSLKLFAAALAVATWGGLAPAQVTTNTFTWNLNQTVPDGSPIGLTETMNLSALSGGIAEVTLSLDVAGGFNGDLYAYLAGPNGGMTVLLNRVGVNGGNAAGYSDAGMNVTFSDTAANGNIHDYQTVAGYAALLNGGAWVPDGRNLDPLSSGSVLEGAATTSNFSVFDGASPNGTWTLFIADLSGGQVATFDGAVLTIMTVPEPSSLALLTATLAGVWALRRRSPSPKN